MIASTMALLTRALQVDARMLRHHLGRLLFVIIIYFTMVYSNLMSRFLGASGLQLFQMMAWMNLIFITLAAFGFFASAITEEKEEETLGLLKMAGMKPLSLLLGKSTSRLVTVGVLLSLQFPFTLLAITLGGVTMEQVQAVYLSMLAYIAFVANLALFWSVAAERTRGAATGVFLTLLLFFVGPPLVTRFCVSTNWASFSPWLQMVGDYCLSASEWLYSISIATRINQILVTGFDASFTESALHPQVLSNLAAAAFLFLLSWLTFEHFTRSRVTTASSWRMSLGRLGSLRLLGAGRAWMLPLAWKDFHFVAGGLMMAGVKFVFYILLVVLFAALQYHWDYTINVEDLGETTMYAMLVAGAIELSLMAGRLFNIETRWKTWATLRMLPTGLPAIVYAKVAGCLLALIPAILVMGLGAMMAPDEFIYFMKEVFLHWAFWLSLLVFGAFIHLTALLSLYVKWGALPLAIGIMIVSYMFFVMGIGLLFMFASMAGASPSWLVEEVIATVLIGFFLFINVSMEVLIGLRLRKLASM